ncbi:YceI family protein [Rudanella lutea]|jgi:polyisoprenoid-binding protein YceI|uniref:YceI family protein n=1 Tax=Rudanella lutea TaxID=451374 RepID=UPI000489D02A|nr:YceI family protein [Rudanella lutea]
MKRLSLLVAVALSSLSTYAQTWTLDKSHSRLGFTVTHLMLTEVDGNFKTIDATVTSSKPDLSDAVFELTADVNSINTENERRDGHLKSADFFDTAKFPTLTFKSTSLKKVEGKKYKLMGDLTMHGVTKPVTLDLVMNGPITQETPRGKSEKVGIKVSGTLKRSDFGVGSSSTAVVSDEVELRGAAEFAKQNAVTEKK